jgi:AGZA family xanthine/uracil permease-like MFS transporter
LHERDSHHHAENAIERTRIANSVQMRAQQEDAFAWFGPRKHTAQITGRIKAHAHTSAFHPLTHNLIAASHGGRKESSERAATHLANGGEFSATRNDGLRTSHSHIRYSKQILISKAEEYFEFRKLGTTWRTEIMAGITTFVTMAYIVLVNPAILHDAGMPLAAVTAATCLSAAFGSVLMGVFARYPIALAPGMGLNAYFTYVVVKGMGVPWQAALGAVFMSGVVFMLLTLVGIRQMILSAIPTELYSAVSAGVGVFIAFIGLKNAGLVVANPATFVALGNLRSASAAVSMFGLIVIAILLSKRVSGAILIGIASSSVLGILLGLTKWHPVSYALSDLTATAFKLDLGSTVRFGFWEIIFVFLFVDLFDNLGTLVAVGREAGLVDENHQIPRLNRILISDSIATIVSSLVGTSTVVSYIESAAGVEAGGRSGVTAIVTGILFVLSLFALPVIGAIPTAATAPALIIVGSLMMAHGAEIEWRKPTVAIPSFLTLIMIPLTFSIANGLAFGFVAYSLIKIGSGEARRVHWLVYVLTALFIARFIYMGASNG